jgi:hypothetical protein
MISIRSSRVRALVSLALVVALAGCAQVRARRGEPEHAGFLGDYSGLEPREGFEAAEVYLNPNANWVKYNAIQLDSVTLWVKDDRGSYTDEERQMLTDLAFKGLYDALSAQFEMVERPGPRALRMRAALTQARGANVPLRTVTTVIPQLRLLGAGVNLAADTAVTVGSATIEAEVLDAITNERLAAVVDERAGNKALISSRTFRTWGDVEAACEFWGRRTAARLVQLGVRRRPDATELEAEPREF